MTGYGEACPRPYVTGESLDSAVAFFKQHKNSITDSIHDLDSIKTWMVQHEKEIDSNPSAWCAIELALLDMVAKEQALSIEQLLGLPQLTGIFSYTAVLGDADSAVFSRHFLQYMKMGFRDFKLKLSGDIVRDREKITVIKGTNDSMLRVRVDANNYWDNPKQVMDYLHTLDYPFFAVEEPLQIGQYRDLTIISEQLNLKIILDESFIRMEQFNDLADQSDNFIINIRVSKMGGLLRSLNVLEEARSRHINVIIGAQVGETSLLTRAGLTVAQAAKDSLIAQEGAFGTWLLKKDICNPPLMFQQQGKLSVAEFIHTSINGFGLAMLPDPGLFMASYE